MLAHWSVDLRDETVELTIVDPTVLVPGHGQSEAHAITRTKCDKRHHEMIVLGKTSPAGNLKLGSGAVHTAVPALSHDETRGILEELFAAKVIGKHDAEHGTPYAGILGPS